MKWIRTAFACIVVTAGFGCSKGHSDGGNNSGGGDRQLDTFAQAVIKVESLANEMQWLARQVINGSIYPNGSSFFDCAFLQRSYTNEGESITITYDGTCEDNTARKGVLSLNYNEYTGDMTIQPSNFTVDGERIEGSFTFSNVPGEVWGRRLVVLNGKIVPGQGKFIQFSLDRNSRQTAGSTTQNAGDDVYDIYQGSYRISVQDLGMMEGEVASGLSLRHSCHAQAGWMPVSGKIRIATTDDKTGTINFGNGGCDKESKLE